MGVINQTCVAVDVERRNGRNFFEVIATMGCHREIPPRAMGDASERTFQGSQGNNLSGTNGLHTMLLSNVFLFTFWST